MNLEQRARFNCLRNAGSGWINSYRIYNNLYFHIDMLIIFRNTTNYNIITV